MKQVKCKSGLTGWQCHLRENYDSFEEFKRLSEMYGLHTRLKFKSPEDAWYVNPLIQGSVNPGDYRRVQEWFTWVVRYWSHQNDGVHPINDCFGNSATWTGKARTKEEAVKRAEKFVKQFSIWFRWSIVYQKIT